MLVVFMSCGLQERKEMRGVGGGDNVCVTEKHATGYRAEGSANGWDRDEEIATLCPGERERPRLVKDLVA